MASNDDTTFCLKGCKLSKDLCESIEEIISKLAVTEIAKMDFSGDIRDLTERNLKFTDLGPDKLSKIPGLDPGWYGFVRPSILDRLEIDYK